MSSDEGYEPDKFDDDYYEFCDMASMAEEYEKKQRNDIFSNDVTPMTKEEIEYYEALQIREKEIEKEYLEALKKTDPVAYRAEVGDPDYKWSPEEALAKAEKNMQWLKKLEAYEKLSPYSNRRKSFKKK